MVGGALCLFFGCASVSGSGEFSDDVINSYNDGSPELGKPPLGPFYEMETSSPTASLKPGESMTHVQRTFRIQGSREELDPLASRLVGAQLNVIEAAFWEKQSE